MTLAEAPTDVLVYLAGLGSREARTLLGITEAVAPRDADDARGTVIGALRLLLDAGYVQTVMVDDWRMYRVTDAGRQAVAAPSPNERPEGQR